MIIASTKVLADRFNDKVMVFFHSKEAPSFEEAQPFLSYVAANEEKMKHCSMLVLSDGGGPDARTRQHTRQIIENGVFSGRTAVVSRSNILRIIASAVAVYTPRLRVFEPDAFVRAMSHVGLTQNELPALIEKLRHMLAAAPAGSSFKTADEVLRLLTQGQVAPLA
jgi:hypothetical protein